MARAMPWDVNVAHPFEKIFGVADVHRLLAVRSRSRDGSPSGNYWEHEEYDGRGRLVARYESFNEWEPLSGRTRSGWRKYDAKGRLLKSSDSFAPGPRRPGGAVSR